MYCEHCDASLSRPVLCDAYIQQNGPAAEDSTLETVSVMKMPSGDTHGNSPRVTDERATSFHGLISALETKPDRAIGRLILMQTAELKQSERAIRHE